MIAIKSQNLVRLEDSIPETKLVAIVNREPAEITSVTHLEFRPSFDDLDYLVFAILSLPSGDRLGLIRHDNFPSSGTEICVGHNQLNIAAVIQEAITEMNLTIDDLTWIYPEYEQQLKQSKGFESKVISGEEY